MIQATTEKVNTALKKLAKDGKQFALADLDRDSDGVFTAADVTKIKEAVGDEVVAKELFEELRKFGITFENQKVSEVIKKLQDEATKGQRVGVVTSNKPSGESPGFFGRIWAAIVEIFNKITGFFTGSKTSETPPTTQRAQASSASADRVIVSGQLSPPAFPMGAGIGRENEIRLG